MPPQYVRHVSLVLYNPILWLGEYLRVPANDFRSIKLPIYGDIIYIISYLEKIISHDPYFLLLDILYLYCIQLRFEILERINI